MLRKTQIANTLILPTFEMQDMRDMRVIIPIKHYHIKLENKPIVVASYFQVIWATNLNGFLWIKSRNEVTRINTQTQTERGLGFHGAGLTYCFVTYTKYAQKPVKHWKWTSVFSNIETTLGKETTLGMGLFIR